MTRDQFIGRTLGTYTLNQHVGEGGMGVVYRATAADGSTVAVKILTHRGNSRDAKKRLIARFLREGQAATTVEHEHVVRVLDHGTEDNLAFLVMEYVEGASLGQVVDGSRSGGALDVERVTRIVAAIARGLAAIHAKGIVHRDIKPDNILIGRNGAIKIADLGLAKIDEAADSDRLTASGVVVGTPLYVAPEAVRDAHRVGPAADIYSLGATLYHLLCGHPPFSGDSPYELMRAHLEKEPRPVREINPAVPKWLASLVRRCLDKRPEARPSARELALCLHQQHDAGAGRSRIPLVAAALVIILAAAAVVGWRFFAQPSSDLATVIISGSERSGSALSWRSDEGPWQALATTEALRLEGGSHQLQIRTAVAGILLSWTDELVVEAGQEYTIHPNLRPSSSRARYRDFPGPGLVMVAGRAVAWFADATEAQLALAHIGDYPLVLWSPGLIRETTLSVTRDSATDNGWRVVSWPSAQHYFRTVAPPSADHQLPPLDPLPAHHVVSAAEFALVMGEDPSQAGIGPQRQLDPLRVRAWEEAVASRGSALPDRALAQVLSARLGHGVWFREDNRLYYHGAPEAVQAHLIAVPTTARNPQP